MNGDQSKPSMRGHVTRPRPIRGRGNSHVGASRAPRSRDGAEPALAGAALAVTAGAEQSFSPASLQSRQPRNLSSGQHQLCATDLGAKFHYFEIL